MNKSYFERSQGATTFDPELQSDYDLELIIHASKPNEQKEIEE